MNRFTGKVVLIVGATGGLGSAIARAFAAEGATLALAARREGSPAEFGPRATCHRANLTDPASLLALREAVLAAHGRVDVLVNATGYDVRKPLPDHTAEDIRHSLAVNLEGAMLLTQTFLPAIAAGVIVHLGGFADGRLAFPFYSADVATRAGLRAFIEATNRELALVGSPTIVSFFSPSPADTPAEQPYHALWQQMGTPVVAPDAVARELLDAVHRRRKVHIMGGWLTRAFAALNAVAPQLADALQMNRYGAILSQFFSPPVGQNLPVPANQRPVNRTIGIVLIAVSFLAYGLLVGVPFLPLDTAWKVGLSSALVLVGELTFWVGGALLGKELVGRYRRYLNPCSWFRRV